MEKIPTAEEFATERDEVRMPRGVSYQEEIGELMIEFAKLHVKAALKAKVDAMTDMLYEDSSYSMGELDAFTEDSYPLENIK